MSLHRDKTRRIALLPELLSQHSWTTAELAQHLGATSRDILRDLEDLRAHGHAITTSEGRRPRHRLASASRPSSPVQAVITHALLRLLHHHAPTATPTYHEALLGLADALPERVRGVAARSLAPPEGSSDPRLLEIVARAWCEGHPLAFKYRKPGGTADWNEMDVQFMEIGRSNLEWYVIGQRPADTEPRTFMLARMEDATVVTSRSSAPITLDPQQLLAQAWGIIGGGANRCELVLRFESTVRPWVEHRRWPGLIERHVDEEGRVVLRLHAPMHRDGLPVEVLAWVRGWGAGVEVLEPDWVRHRWLGDARLMLDRFS